MHESAPAGLGTSKQAALLRSGPLALLAVAAPLLGFWSGAWLHRTLNGNMATLEMESRVSQDARLQLFFNDRWSDPQTVAVKPGEWTTYRLAAPARLTALRLDPPPIAGAEMQIRAIRLRASDGRSQNLALSTLQSWPRIGLDLQGPDAAGVVHLKALEPGAYTMGALSLDVARPAWPIPPWFRINPASLLWSMLLLAAGLWLAAFAQRSWRGAAGAFLFLASVYSAYPIAGLLQGRLHSLPSVSETVGYAAFFAYPKWGQMEALNAGLLLAGVMSCAAAWLIGLRVSIAACVQRVPWRKRDWIFLAACFAVFAVAVLPPASADYAGALHARQSPDYDSLNVLYWEYAADQGRLPFRDFWYPYSGMYKEEIPLYPYLAYAWASRLMLLAVSIFSLYVCLARSALATLAVVLTLVILNAGGLIWPGAQWRYLLSASVVLLACAALQERRRWLGAALGLWAAYAVAEEASQLAYAALALVLLLAASLAGRRRAVALPVLLAAASCFFAGILGYAAFLLYRGQFHGWVAFLAELRLDGVYSAWPLDFAAWTGLPRDVPQLYLLTIVLLIAGGAMQAVASRFESPALLAPLALGLVAALQLQKEMIRPGIATQLLPVSAAGIAILMGQQILQSGRFRRVAVAGAYGGVALLTLFFLLDPPGRAQLAGQFNVAGGARENAAFMAGHARAWSQAKAHFFSPDAMDFGGMSGTAFRTELESATHLHGRDSIFVLGDRPDVYILLGKPAPYYITIYNQSPLLAQANTLRWLDRYQPPFVLWNAEAREFDSVPNTVRVPLLFRYVVSRYLPAGAVGPFQLLRLRPPDQPIDIAYWKRELGTTQQLGYIPSLSDAGAAARPRGPIAARYLLVDVGAPVQGRVRTVEINIAGEVFSIQFRERAQVYRYSINLERLPWAGLDSGMPTLTQPPEPGAHLQLALLRFDAEPLY